MRSNWILLLLVFIQPLAAQELYVRNQPFQGVVEHLEGELYVAIEPLAEALELELLKHDDVWHLGDIPCSGSEVGPGLFWGTQRLNSARLDQEPPLVALRELSELLEARLVHSAELNTIDLFLPAAGSAGIDQDAYHAVVFTTGELGERKRIEQSLVGTGVELVVVDVEQRESEAYKTFGKFFQLGSLPASMLLSPSRRVLARWEGLPQVDALKTARQQHQQRIQASHRAAPRVTRRRAPTRVMRGG